MATSGTTSSTVFRNQAIIDHAGRNAGLSPQQITGEHIQTALECLFLSVSRLANKGQPLWRLSNVLLGLYPREQSVECPLGVADVRNLNLRQVQRVTGVATASEGVAANAFDGDVDTACVQLAANGFIQAQFDQETQLSHFGVLPGLSGEWSFSLQASDDGVVFTTFHSESEVELVDGEWLWFDVEGVPPTTYLRLQATGGTVLDVRELFCGNTPQEIPVALINVDDYANLPNKTFQGRPTQYWLQRLRERQVITLWPAPNDDYVFWQLVAQVYRYVEDPGTMADQLDVPQRWYDCMIDDLAVRLCKQIKEADRSRLPDLKQDAAESWRDAWDGESDRAPSRILPNIRPYTR